MPQRRTLTAEDVRRGGLCFKPKTGLGADHFHPRWFAWLPEMLRHNIALFLMRLEQLGYWPTQLRITMIALIPKKIGKRSIGLLVSLIRLWERLRVTEVRAWKEANFRD